MVAVRGLLTRVSVALFVAIAVSALLSGAALGAECPNEARRKEQNATYLPDCRAYEMVSPVDKKGSDVVGANNTAQISDSGERATFETFSGIGQARGSGGFGFFQYVTNRGEGGWESPFGLDPQPVKNDVQLVSTSTGVPLLSKSFDTALVEGYQMVGSTTPDIPDNFNMYDESVESGALVAITSPSGVDPSEIEPFEFEYGFRGASSDLGVIAFQGEGNLLPGLPYTNKLYEWNRGKLEVAGVLPNGTLPAGGSGGARRDLAVTEERSRHAVSADGSRVLFRAPVNGSKPAQLYMRKNGTSTVWVSQSEASTPNPEPKGVEYLDMAANGKVLFASRDPLTDSDPGGEGWGLYLYTDGPNPEAEQNLTFIARVQLSGASEAGQAFTGMSEDGKRVYFFSGTGATLSPQGTYLWDEGTLSFVAPTAFRLSAEFVPNGTGSQAELSADGSRLAFTYPHQLTEAPVGLEKTAMYLYEEATNSLKCVSCLPTGGPTTSSAKIWPEADEVLPNNLLDMKGKFISKDGRYVFFSTADALLPQDVNGVEDVYEYDAQTGNVSLLSSGTGGQGSWFTDASPDGSNVMFVSRQPYVARDADKLIDVYDVRIDGGFPQPPPSTGACVGDECQGVPSAAPSFNTASGFTGLGNVVRPSSEKPRPKSLTRAQKLKRALKACKRRRGKARRRCEAQARKRYGAHKASKSTSHAAPRR